MIKLRYHPDYEPMYQTEFSACCDLKARMETILPAGAVAAIPTGIWIDSYSNNIVRDDLTLIPELQIRARSGLAFKNGISLANGIGTIDADYPDEIKVLLINHSQHAFSIFRGDRIAQLCANYVVKIPDIPIKKVTREGGFGSTGVIDE